MSAVERTPWLLFMPDGTWDGTIWSPESADEAGSKLFGGKRQWAAKQKQGWTCRRGGVGEHHALLKARLDGASA